MENKKTFFEDYTKLIASFDKIKKNGSSNWGSHIHINDVLNPVKENCAKHNFISIQRPIHKDGKNLLATTLLHKDGERIDGEIEIVAKDPNDPQKLGGSITYMRRYSLVTMLGIEGEDDDGDSASTPKPTQAQQARPQYVPNNTPNSNSNGFM